MPKVGIVALLALLSFPLVAILIFRRYPPAKATIVTNVLALMYLPGGEAAVFDFPLIPPMGKEDIATLSVLLGILIFHSKRLFQARPGRGLEALSILAMVGLIGTWRGNQFALTYGTFAGIVPGVELVVLPPFSLKDIFGYAVRDSLTFILPFIIGRTMFRTRSDMRVVCHVLVGFGLVYVPLMLVEMRLSPMIHGWVYGYFPHADFSQTMRWGGYRAQVFFAHGLVLGRMQLVVFMAALALYLGGEARAWRFDAKQVVRVMVLVVIFTKSMGVTLFMFFFGPLFSLTKQKTQIRVVTVLAVLVFLYPYGRTFELLDFRGVVSTLEKYAPQRAESVAYRFRNERELSERASEKLWFGWGGWSRSHIWEEEMALDLSVTDGYWIIRLGEMGLFGLIGPFVIMLGPVIFLSRRYKKIPWDKDRQMLIVLGGVSLIFAIECLPNSISTNMPFLMAGVVWSLTSRLSDPSYIAGERRRERPRPPHGPPGAGPPPPFGPPGAGPPPPFGPPGPPYPFGPPGPRRPAPRGSMRRPAPRKGGNR